MKKSLILVALIVC
jgi:hypothetical protein